MTYPLEPLAAALGVPLNSLGRHLGVSGSTWKEYRDRGVSERVADRLAVKAGLHPIEVWPEIIAEAELACRECGTGFVPGRSDQIYCGVPCRRRVASRMWKRRKQASDEAWCEEQRRRQRVYYQETADYARREARRRYWADPDRERDRQREIRRAKAAA